MNVRVKEKYAGFSACAGTRAWKTRSQALCTWTNVHAAFRRGQSGNMVAGCDCTGEIRSADPAPHSRRRAARDIEGTTSVPLATEAIVIEASREAGVAAPHVRYGAETGRRRGPGLCDGSPARRNHRAQDPARHGIRCGAPASSRINAAKSSRAFTRWISRC